MNTSFLPFQAVRHNAYYEWHGHRVSVVPVSGALIVGHRGSINAPYLSSRQMPSRPMFLPPHRPPPDPRPPSRPIPRPAAGSGGRKHPATQPAARVVCCDPGHRPRRNETTFGGAAAANPRSCHASVENHLVAGVGVVVVIAETCGCRGGLAGVRFGERGQ